MDQPLFEDRGVLEGEDAPVLLGRGVEIRHAIMEFQDGPLNVTPASAIVYGAWNSGKSAVLRATCAEMERRADRQDDYDIEIIHVNCASLTDRRDLLFEILRQLDNRPSQEIDPGGRKFVPYTWLTEELEAVIEELDVDLVVFSLDDIDSIESPETALSDIIQQDSDTGGSRVGFIATSTSIDVYDSVHRLKRKYRTSEIVLDFLGEREHRRALQIHADSAFGESVVNDEAIEAVQEWGFDSARIGDALAILKHAGDRATSTGAQQITASHVEHVINEYEIHIGVNWLQDMALDVHDQAILLALAKTDESEVRIRSVYEEYCAILDDSESNPLSYRRFRERVTEERLWPFIATDKKNRGARGGVYCEVKLDCDPEMIFIGLNSEAYLDLPRTHIPETVGKHFSDVDQPLR